MDMFKYLDIAREAKVNIALWGGYGVGKSERMEDYAEDRNGHLETLVLGQIDSVTLGGHPIKVETHEATGKPVQIFATPIFIVNLWQAAKEGKLPILFLDELNRADKYALNAAMTLVQSKWVNGHRIPPNTLIVAAMNPPSDNDMGIMELHEGLISRFCHLAVHSDTKDWLDWADKKGMPESLMGLIRQRGEVLNTQSLNFYDAVGRLIAPTNRAWANVGRIVNVLQNPENGYSQKDLETFGHTMFSGLVGAEHAAIYMEFLKNNYEEEFSFEEISSPTKKVFDRIESLKERNRHEVIMASLTSFHKESNKRYEEIRRSGDPEKIALLLKGIEEGFLKFLYACPSDKVASFFRIDEKENLWNDQRIITPLLKQNPDFRRFLKPRAKEEA